jgi:tRNA (guanosine-2'-O-)-methyltransferase
VSDKVDQLIAKYGEDVVLRALAPMVSEGRLARIEAVLDARLSSLTVVLENLHDPHNGAAAIRSVEGFGLDSLWVVEAVEPFQFSSSVTVGCEKWIDVHRFADGPACAAALRARGFRLLATLPGESQSIEEVDVSGPCALVFGNEHEGLTQETIASCDGRVSIPMFGFTQSFNLSVSVALCVQRLAARRRAVLGGRGDLPEAERRRLRARWYALGVRAAEQIVERHVSDGTR